MADRHPRAGQCKDRASPTPLFGHLGGQALLPGRAGLCCHSSPGQVCKAGPSPRTDLLPPALPAAPTSSSSARCREAGSTELLANARRSSLPPPYPTVPIFLLNLASPFPGTPLAGRRRAGTWPPGRAWTQCEVLGCAGMPQQEFYSLFPFSRSFKDISESL